MTGYVKASPEARKILEEMGFRGVVWSRPSYLWFGPQATGKYYHQSANFRSTSTLVEIQNLKTFIQLSLL
jgi:hypothetical protein